jgi:hypothetical protein
MTPAILCARHSFSFFLFWNFDLLALYTPPPRSIGIIMLRENRDLIQGIQSLAGKILSRKDFAPMCSSRQPLNSER